MISGKHSRAQEFDKDTVTVIGNSMEKFGIGKSSTTYWKRYTYVVQYIKTVGSRGVGSC